MDWGESSLACDTVDDPGHGAFRPSNVRPVLEASHSVHGNVLADERCLTTAVVIHEKECERHRVWGVTLRSDLGRGADPILHVVPGLVSVHLGYVGPWRA